MGLDRQGRAEHLNERRNGRGEAPSFNATINRLLVN
ncbi:MAG: hypothetical protein ACI88U_001494 [Porticoccaceae bacterium]|jgi:hypothetical protein